MLLIKVNKYLRSIKIDLLKMYLILHILKQTEIYKNRRTSINSLVVYLNNDITACVCSHYTIYF